MLHDVRGHILDTEHLHTCTASLAMFVLVNSGNTILKRFRSSSTSVALSNLNDIMRWAAPHGRFLRHGLLGLQVNHAKMLQSNTCKGCRATKLLAFPKTMFLVPWCAWVAGEPRPNVAEQHTQRSQSIKASLFTWDYACCFTVCFGCRSTTPRCCRATHQKVAGQPSVHVAEQHTSTVHSNKICFCVSAPCVC